jgi:aryl-alcohol dehydrogenase-like predicted oxidoreductase
MISGNATATGTARFRLRFRALAAAGHFRQPEGVKHLDDLWFSSVGLGTYLGEPDGDTDQRYTNAALQAVETGVNLLDSAINYRFQRSERSLGAALKQAVEEGTLQRDEAIVCTKAGYLTYDGTVPADPREYFEREYISNGIVPRNELVGGMHCMAPNYLRDQIERSRKNLGIETIDLFYLHNPEQQLGEVSRETFHERLRKAFAALEEEVADGRIRAYGTATWNGYRQAPSSREYLDLAAIAEIAREAGGDDHHFRVVQVPFNLGLPEAFTNTNQTLGSKQVSLVDAARELGIGVVGSATLLQGRLAGRLPEFVRETLDCATDAEAAIQFARSAPGITTALIGMSRKEHVEANLRVANKPLTERQTWESLFSKAQ